jgi:hypothetical protein
MKYYIPGLFLVIILRPVSISWGGGDVKTEPATAQLSIPLPTYPI